MYYRPWPLVIIAIFHILEPFTKVAYYSIMQQTSPLAVIANQFQSNDFMHIFGFFCLFPIAGIAIYAVKRWSLGVFLGAECWALIANFSQLSYLVESTQYGKFATIIFFAVLNTVAVVYLMVPAVRIAYTDPKLRWWEAFARYYVDWNCTYASTEKGTIKNISKGGLFIKPENNYEKEGVVPISFTFGEHKLNLSGRVIHNFTFEGIKGFGVEFHELDNSARQAVNNIIKDLETKKTKRRPERRAILNSFFTWAKKLPEGEGIFPESKHRSQKNPKQKAS
ncbi:MAG: PilZ domain-containing protein [Oligoflexales bacterium]